MAKLSMGDGAERASAPGTAMIDFPFSVSARRLRALLLLLGAGIAIVISGTWLAMNRAYLPAWVPEPVRFLIFQMDLGPENRIGTWYSSFLFLLPAPIALACFWVQRRTASGRRDRLASYGWLGVAVMFVLLSATELGSIHNRVGLHLVNPLRGLGIGGWVGVLAIPILIVGALLLWFTWRQIREHPIVGAVLGAAVLILLTIPVQEYIESRLRHGFIGEHGEYLRPALHVILEEGGEMVSALLFITAFVMFLAVRLPAARAAGWFGAESGWQRGGLTLSRADTDALFRSGQLEGTVRVPAQRLRTAVYAALVAVGIGMVLFYAVFELWWTGGPGHWGRPLNWFPAQMAALIALAAFYLARRGPMVSEPLAGARGPLLALAVFSLVVAANQGANLSMLHVLWEGSPRRQLGVAVAFAAAGIGIAAWLAVQVREAGRLLLVTWGVTLAFAFLFLARPNGAMPGVVAAAYGALLLGLGRACAAGTMPKSTRASAATAFRR